MNCPDCGSGLEKTSVGGFDESYRCNACGGVWLSGWVVNKIAQNPEEKLAIEPMEPSGEKLPTGGSGNCPTDKILLALQSGEEIPSQVVSKKCNKCQWWWVPDNQIFDLQKAYQLKKDYTRVWAAKPKWQTMVWPAIFSLVLLVGLVGSVGLISQQQRPGIGASVGVTDWTVASLGEGNALVGFTSGLAVSSVQYKSKTSNLWQEVAVSCSGDKCEARLSNLVPGEEYMVRVMGKEYTFKVQ